MNALNAAIEGIIQKEVRELNRPDLFRAPIMAVSSALDLRYPELKNIIGDWHLNPRELLHDAQSVISYFVPLTRPVIAQPIQTDDGSPLWGEAYVTINAHFDVIGRAVSNYLENLGYSAHPIAGTHTYDPKNLKSMWSHRSAAAIAGLGAFAANRLLITPKGSGGRFCTILTSAPLKTNDTPATDPCLYHKNGSCGLCFKACPARALKPDSFERFVCHDDVLLKNAENLKAIGFCDVCGKCFSVCPFAYIE